MQNLELERVLDIERRYEASGEMVQDAVDHFVDRMPDGKAMDEIIAWYVGTDKYATAIEDIADGERLL